jgi:hypothetical protein
MSYYIHIPSAVKGRSSYIDLPASANTAYLHAFRLANEHNLLLLKTPWFRPTCDRAAAELEALLRSRKAVGT